MTLSVYSLFVDQLIRGCSICSKEGHANDQHFEVGHEGKSDRLCNRSDNATLSQREGTNNGSE